MARSHKDQFIKALRGETYERANVARLTEVLGSRWTEEKVEQKAREFGADDTIPICITPQGIQYFGCENGVRPGLYKEVRRGIQRRWGRDNGMRNTDVFHTSRVSTRGQGIWTQPDLIAQVQRRSDASPRTVNLAIEVEQPGGFGLQSVYQAYEFGRGADFSWVFYAGPVCEKKKMERVEIAARDLGVGVVHAARPTQPSKWTTQIPARIRTYTRASQDDFLSRVGATNIPS